MAEFNKILLYALIVLMVVTGSINTIATKVQQKMPLNTRLLFENHQFCITCGMFVGEFLLLFGYLHVLYQRKKQNELPEEEKKLIANKMSKKELKQSLKPHANNCIFCITAACDLCATTLGTFGITYLSTSMYQMFRGLELTFVLIFSNIFLGNPIYRQHAMGVGSVIFGLSLVGLNAILNKGDSAIPNPFLGMICLIISQFFSSSQYVLQEKILTKYQVNSFQLVGFEGTWGCILYSILLIIFQNINCNTWSYDMRSNLCYKDLNNNYVLENTLLAFRQLGANVYSLLLMLLYISSIAIYNYVGINLTQLVSSTARAIVDTVRTVFVWFFFLWFPWVPKGAQETFYPLQFVGFMFLILGTVVYNEIVPLPFLNLDYYYRDKIKERKKEEKRLKKEAEEGQQPTTEVDKQDADKILNVDPAKILPSGDTSDRASDAN